MTLRTMPKIVFFLLILANQESLAWGPEGHAAVGIGAIKQLDKTARLELELVLGDLSGQRMEELCNWPDAMRELPEWKWSSPQHYVNLPRSDSSYDPQRDCRDGLCVTEAIKKYASRLQNDQLDQTRRTQAFAWLCHLAGDIHQPLHCGFGDDRGGNEVKVRFEGETIKLHEFWDSALIQKKAGSLNNLLQTTSDGHSDSGNAENYWNPDEVDQWTVESHELAMTRSYPDDVEINETFEDESWQLIQQQLPLASTRLARILNATLGEGEVILGQAAN